MVVVAVVGVLEFEPMVTNVVDSGALVGIVVVVVVVVVVSSDMTLDDNVSSSTIRPSRRSIIV